jgi:hypothetical protein
MCAEFATTNCGHLDEECILAKDLLWRGDMYVRLHLRDGSWIKIKVTEKHPDYAVVNSDVVKLSVTPTASAAHKKDITKDDKIRASFVAAIKLQERRRLECIEIIEQKQEIIVKLEKIRQNLDLCQLRYDSGNYCR